MQQLHEIIYKHLINKHRQDNSFRFTTRITNRFSRLDKGYWFHGNEQYIAISFWTGTDWMNKTPNIYFCITDTECFLMISVFDSENKQVFAKKYLEPPRITDLIHNGRYYKWIADTSLNDVDSIISALDDFLAGDKLIIDEAVSEANELLKQDDNSIGFIPLDTFTRLTKKIESYRKKRIALQRDQKIEEIIKENPQDEELLRIVEKPYGITKLMIQSFLGIDGSVIDEIPHDTRCIFLTGENGTGKTSILKAIGCALTNDHLSLIGTECNNYTVQLELSNGGDLNPIIELSANSANKVTTLQIEGYAAYGPYRLMTNHRNEKSNNEPNLSLYNESLFDPSPVLYDIEKGIAALPNINDIEKENRKKIITAAIRDMLPGFRKFIWGNELEPTLYELGYANSEEILEESESEFDLEKLANDKRIKVTYDKLASGAKNVISMVGDMIVRLFMQQPHISDIGELRGFVLIDEIDIHLHPIFQKSIVQQLADNFPEIQFIITTHSPIPLLGAPKKSVIYRVGRDARMNINVERVDTYLKLVNSNPNLLLTSPVFGFKNLFPSYHDSLSGRMRTEDHYDEYWFRQMLEAKLNNIRTENL